MAETLIDIPLNDPNLRVQDRQYLQEVIARANYNLAIGNFEPLLITLRTYHDPEIGGVQRERIRTHFSGLLDEAQSLNDADLIAAVEVEARARIARSDVFDEYCKQIEHLLDVRE